MNFRYRTHSEFVKKWSNARTAPLSSAQVQTLFELAIQKLWDYSRTSISAVLMATVFDRVLCNTVARYKFLELIEIEENGPNFSKLRKNVSKIEKEQLVFSMQLVLVELIAILGNLTNEVIVVGLYKQLTLVNTNAQLKANPKNGAKK